MKSATSADGLKTGRRCARATVATGLAAVLLAAHLGSAARAMAGQARRTDGGISGRIFDPSRLRTRKEAPADPSSGRALQPRVTPDPEKREPVVVRAEIPNPEPRARGGQGLERRGKYFYDAPRPPELARPGASRLQRETIPRPEVRVRTRSEALRASTRVAK